jgi:putative peptidoglycan lipid II flippase
MTARSGFTKAFSRVALGTFISRVLGLVREQVFAHLFGASMAADAFFAAYRIPNLLRDLFAEGALSSAFVPIFKREMKQSGNEAAFELAQVCYSALTVVLGVVTVIGILLAPYLVTIIAPGFGAVAGKAELTGQLTAYMFPFLLLVALAALAMSILNSFDRFGLPAVASGMFNLGSIVAAYTICPYLERPIFGMAAGVLLGGLGQFAIQVPSLYRIGFRFRFRLQWRHPGLKEIAKLMTPMVSGLAASRINVFVNTLLASLLAAGSVSYLTYSFRIMHLPLGIIAVGLGTVALPKASALAADNDTAGLTRTFYRATHLCFFLVMPVAAFLIACGDEVVALLFQHGRFVAADTANTYQALIWYSVGLIGFAGVRVTAPLYFAFKDAVRPMKYSIVSVVVNLAANVAFVPWMNFAGLALATGVGGVVNFVLLLYHLPRLVPTIRLAPVIMYFIRSTIAAALSGLLVYFVKLQPWFLSFGAHLTGRMTRMTILIGVGAVGYFLASFALNNIPSIKGTKER